MKFVDDTRYCGRCRVDPHRIGVWCGCGDREKSLREWRERADAAQAALKDCAFAIVNMLDDGDLTDRRQARAALEKAKAVMAGSFEPPATETKDATQDKAHEEYYRNANILRSGGRDRD